MKKILSLIVTVMTCLLTGAVAVPKPDHSYVVVLGGDSLDAVMTDSVFYKISRRVVFPVNKFDIPANSGFRREMLSEVLPYFGNGDFILHSVLIRGAASPEGPYAWNQTLSHLRRKALLKLINENVKYRIDSCLKVKEVAEDYVYLCMLMKERGDEDHDRVKALVDQYFDTDQRRLKEKLMSMDGGRLWKRLLKEYFPEMRAARVVLVFRKRIEIKQEEPAKADFTTEVPTSSALGVGPFTVSVPMEIRIPRREILSVKTNLLFDLAYMPGYDRFCPIPNIAVEYYPLHGHFTFGASLDFPWWQHYHEYKYFQIRNYQLEARYYFKSGDVNKVGYGKGAAFTGWYAQAYAHAGLFGICFDEDRGWEGEGVGGGVGIGYVLPLTKTGHWRLEFGAQAGIFWSKYDPYQYESVIYPELHDDLYYYKWDKFGNLFKRRQHRFTWLGPTRVGVTLTYDLLYRRRAKKGVSFKSWEVLK